MTKALAIIALILIPQFGHASVTRTKAIIQSVESVGTEVRVKYAFEDQLGNVQFTELNLCADADEQTYTDAMRAIKYMVKYNKVDALAKSREKIEVGVQGPWNSCLEVL